MNERPTPETDAFSNRSFEHRSDELEKLYDHAIRLERERDEAREALGYIAHAGLSAQHIEDYAKEFLRREEDAK